MMSTVKSHERKGPWMVVEMTQRWKKQKLQRGAKPTIQHHTFNEAVQFALDKCNEKPGAHFAIFECIGWFEIPLAKEKENTESPDVRSVITDVDFPGQPNLKTS